MVYNISSGFYKIKNNLILEIFEINIILYVVV